MDKTCKAEHARFILHVFNIILCIHHSGLRSGCVQIQSLSHAVSDFVNKRAVVSFHVCPKLAVSTYDQQHHHIVVFYYFTLQWCAQG